MNDEIIVCPTCHNKGSIFKFVFDIDGGTRILSATVYADDFKEARLLLNSEMKDYELTGCGKYDVNLRYTHKVRKEAIIHEDD